MTKKNSVVLSKTIDDKTLPIFGEGLIIVIVIKSIWRKV